MDEEKEAYNNRFQYSSTSSCPLDHSNSFGHVAADQEHYTTDHHQEQEQEQEQEHHQLIFADHDDDDESAAIGLEMMIMYSADDDDDDIIKTQIANHPLYPNLLQAYIDCTEVGAPAEMASLLEEMSREKHPLPTSSTCTSHNIGTDPQLDDFMRSYCEILHKYKEELSKPFDEATNFLSTIESQLTHLCRQTLPYSSTTYPPLHHSPPPDDVDEDMNRGEVESGGKRGQGDQELKEMLMRKYSGYLSRLKKEFLKKRKKGKLPKGALNALLDWWNTHYRWPYPTEEEKNKLSEITGLEQKQINNWFINQRKRHWRPSEDMRFALMGGVGGGDDTSNA